MSTNEFICALLGFKLEWCYSNEMPTQSKEWQEYQAKMGDYYMGKAPNQPVKEKTAQKVTFPKCNDIDLEDTICELTKDFEPEKCQRLKERINEAFSKQFPNGGFAPFKAICDRYKAIWGEDAPYIKTMALIDEHAQKSQSKAKRQSSPTPKPKSFPKYKTQIKEDTARNMFAALCNGEYISNEASVKDWLYVCGLNDQEPTKPIDWLRGQNELVYFVGELFQTLNANNIWALTAKIFTISNNAPKPANLRRAWLEWSIDERKKTELDKIIEIK